MPSMPTDETGVESHTLLVLGAHDADVALTARAILSFGHSTTEPSGMVGQPSTCEMAYQQVTRINAALLRGIGIYGEEWHGLDHGHHDSEVLDAPTASATQVLADLRGNGHLAVLYGRDLCRLVPFWSRVAALDNTAVSVVLVASAPVILANAVQAYRNGPPTTGLLVWLGLMLEAERATRTLRRRVMRPEELQADWRSTLAGIGKMCKIELSGKTAAQHDIEQLFATHVTTIADVPALSTVAEDWIRIGYDAILRLADLGENNESYITLDRIHAEFSQASSLFEPFLANLQRRNRALVLERDDALSDESERTKRLNLLELERFSLDAELHDSRRKLATMDSELVLSRAAADRLQQELDAEHTTIARLREDLARQHAEVAASDHRCALLGTEARLNAGTQRAALSHIERTLLHQIEKGLAAARRPLARWIHWFGLGYKQANRIESQMQIIANFLDELPWPLVGVEPDGRRQRILRYLAGITDFLPDFPFVRNIEYTEMYPDVAEAAIPPLVHFIAHGQAEERNVHPMFNTAYYLSQHPEARHVASSPVVHYLKWGMQKGFDPHPLFSTNGYLRRYTDVGISGRNPLLHWIENFRCSVHPLFDADFYLNAYPDVMDAGRNPLTHYLLVGWKEGRNPHPMFDTNFYLAALPHLRHQGINPLIHYVETGWCERRKPGPDFDAHFYMVSNPDLGADVDLLRHYIEHGRAEGRLALSPDGPPAATASPGSAQAPLPAAIESPDRALSPLVVTVSGPPVALMIDAFYPRPDQDSGSLDQLSFVQIFKRLGYEVHFLSLLEFGQDYDQQSPRYREAMRQAGVYCVTSTDHHFIESYYFLEGDRINVAFASRVHFGGAQIETIRKLCPAARIIFNTVDLHFVREEREGRLKNEPALIAHAQRTRDLECRLAEQSDATIVVSTSEKEVLDDLVPTARVAVVPLIRDFSQSLVNTYADRRDIAFIGGFMHQPNVDAIEYFIAEIWPNVRQRRSDITLRVVGSNMPDAMKRRKVPGVEFVGYVENLEEELSRLRMTVAPLRYGAGAKGKVVSSLGNGVPCVASRVAAEGMGITEGVLLVAELDASFADQIIRLYDDEALWMQQSLNGQDFIRRYYSIDKGYDLMRSLLSQIGAVLPTTN